MTFNGFTPDTAAFLWDLAFHNERPWFQANRARFLAVLKEPFDALARDTLARMEEKYPDEAWQLHISRIYRDARRLFGRGPYKDHLWFTIWSGTERHDNPAFWFQISASSWGCGVGFFEAEPCQMEAYRQYILDHPAEVESLARRLTRQKVFFLDGEDYKRPKGDVGELLNPWYNKKWMGISAEYDFGGDVLSPDLPRILTEGYGFLMPYYRFLCRFRDVGKEENYSDK